MEGIGALVPAQNCDNVSPSDSADLPHASRGIICGGAGDVSVDFIGSGTAITFTLQAGVVYPFQVRRIRNTGTTATGLRVLY